jgi:hypothetical protein
MFQFLAASACLLGLTACTLPIGSAHQNRVLVLGIGVIDMPDRSDDALQVETKVLGAAITTGEHGALAIGYASSRRLYTPPNYGWISPALTAALEENDPLSEEEE